MSCFKQLPLKANLIQRCELLEIKCGWNSNSALLSGPTSWGFGGVRTSKRSRGWNVFKICTIWVLVFYYSSLRNTFTTVAFLFNKLTYKSPSYASAHCIHPSLLMTSWLTTTVFSVSDLFCRKMSEKVYLSMKTVNYQKMGRVWMWTFLRVSKQVKARGFNWGVIYHTDVSNLTHVFVSVVVFPLKHIIKVSFAFLPSKVTELLWRKFVPILNDTWDMWS